MQHPIEESHQPHPEPVVPANAMDLQKPCLTEDEVTLIDNFHKQLERIQMEYCATCKERWFELKVSNGMCARCRRGGRNNLSAENNMDPGLSLPQLCIRDNLPPPEPPTQMEEMLLSKVHVQLQVWQVAGRVSRPSLCRVLTQNPELHRSESIRVDLS
ncbi:hypothetical protein TREMEDRAFT_63451 [Tremella mesenterica DSM 1558]|uniref:uncharacterized protein n=1 Tax=Tremella mesenterica (strain ATCC 24925 / CBS 8224 / DSM 1558 / NBRC 9311 / NRRL Y-6157 / RJB 2259-6 / UBC 559-6) TaxID=578456 RepID=UPI0003F48C07|nr:uncharacterized protein TREMEDRAFT_63451 [Tremella mesenterica DSM 1558]EIW68278.1 hypothetical protein TREMEDRAFT_63451 [Tremella mesenterica DSM 1558]